MLGSERVRRRLDIIAVVGLVGWLAFDLTARTLFGSVPWPQSVVDYRLLYRASQHVAATHEYPAHIPYPYPPPGVAVQAASAALPYPVAAMLWLVLTGLAAVGCYVALARVLDLHRRPGMLVVLPVAHALAAYYFQWDMRANNCNLLMLAAVLFGCVALTRGRDAAAGFWFAFAVAFKLLPVLVLPYLAWTRRGRALAFAVGFSLVFWVGVPLIAFGASGTRTVYAGWVGELTRTTDVDYRRVHPILISLEKSAAHLTADADAARAVVLGVCGLWVLVGLLGAAASWGKHPRDGSAILTHISLLMLGPIAVNPYLEPYHLVPLAVPAMVLAAATASPGRRRVRLVAATGFVLALGLLKVSSPWPLRGLVVNMQSLMLCGTALWATWARMEIPDNNLLRLWQVTLRTSSRRIPCPESVSREPEASAAPERLGAALASGSRLTTATATATATTLRDAERSPTAEQEASP